MRKGSTLYYLGNDHLGGTSIVMNASGSLVSRTRYYAYGMVWTQEGAPPTDKLFTGYQRVGGSTSGLYYAASRFYSADIGRFLSPDTMVPGASDPQALNRYSYVLNNPLTYTDPGGHCIPDYVLKGGCGPDRTWSGPAAVVTPTPWVCWYVCAPPTPAPTPITKLIVSEGTPWVPLGTWGYEIMGGGEGRLGGVVPVTGDPYAARLWVDVYEQRLGEAKSYQADIFVDLRDVDPREYKAVISTNPKDFTEKMTGVNQPLYQGFIGSDPLRAGDFGRTYWFGELPVAITARVTPLSGPYFGATAIRYTIAR